METAIRISLSTALLLHEVAAPFHGETVILHIDSENNFPECRKEMIASSGGNNDTGELPGHFRQRTLYTRSLRVKKTGNKREKLDMLDAFVDTARELAEAYPHLEQWERRMHFHSLEFEVGMIKKRTRGCKDFSAALPLVAIELGVSPGFER